MGILTALLIALAIVIGAIFIASALSNMREDLWEIKEAIHLTSEEILVTRSNETIEDKEQ